MIKKKLYGDTLKAQLVASARDRAYNFSLADGAVRAVMINGTRMVNEMRSNHELGILETLVLGRAYLGAGLMSATLKGHDRLSLQIECSGPVRGLVVESNAYGEVRGFLKRVPIPIEKPMENFDLSPFFGAGFLSVTRYLEDAKQPFTGTVTLAYGNIAKDLAHYYLTSEQIPTAFNLSIQFDRAGIVVGAGGLFLQAMPGAGDDITAGLEGLVEDFPSLGREFSAGSQAEEIIDRVFGAYSPRLMANHRIEFMCHCNKGKIHNMLAMLPFEDLKDLLEKGPFPVESICHHCSTAYHFSREEIAAIYGMRFPDN
jgi:molecular chaperone Hsp33